MLAAANTQVHALMLAVPAVAGMAHITVVIHAVPRVIAHLHAQRQPLANMTAVTTMTATTTTHARVTDAVRGLIAGQCASTHQMTASATMALPALLTNAPVRGALTRLTTASVMTVLPAP